MIFFILPEKQRKANRNARRWDQITQPSSAPPAKMSGKRVLVAWNEVYADKATLRRAVLAAAANDPVCQDIRAQALQWYGIDPLLQETGNGKLEQATLDTIADNVFNYWTHPLIGNILVSPQMRPDPLTPATPPLLNWARCTQLDETTRAAIAQLPTALDRSRRDQVRICANIVELARAIVGEIACDAAKRLEKILALRLCLSPTLLATQVGMLMAFTRKPPDWFRDLPTEPFWDSLEYTKYYLTPGASLARDAVATWCLFERMLKGATGGAYEPTSPDPKGRVAQVMEQCRVIWMRLPPQMRCAILMNDLRRLSGAPKPHKVSLGVQDIGTSPPAHGKEPAYTVMAAAPQTLGDLRPAEENARLEDKKWGMAWSWNRDEYAATTITYRRFLCPLWAGPSGHATGMLVAWQGFLREPTREQLTREQVCAIASGHFALWRVYYDKRITANHTLAETFEATAIPEVAGRLTKAYTADAPAPPPARGDDAFNLVLQCYDARGFVDPILLLRWLRLLSWPDPSADANYKRLDQKIDQWRGTLAAAKFSVPRWSDAIGAGAGLAVPSFAAQQAPPPNPAPQVRIQSSSAVAARALVKK